VQTATALVDIPSPQSGRIAALLAAEGEALAPQAPLLEFSGTAAIRQNGAEAPQEFSIGRHRHTEARLQQSTQRRRARSNSKPSP
jgi:pyruvate/2-oxoglutarate dehydrogenase complex dihydrolipoamide acyltransferase (E2) component